MVVLGFSRGCHAFPYFITYYNVNGSEHPTLMMMWVSLAIAGNGWGSLLILLVVYGFGWSWMASLMVYNLVFFVLGVVFHV